jgi:hypothetical protein
LAGRLFVRAASRRLSPAPVVGLSRNRRAEVSHGALHRRITIGPGGF